MVRAIQSFFIMPPHSNAGQHTRETGNIAARSLNLSRSMAFSYENSAEALRIRVIHSVGPGHGIGCLHWVYLSFLARFQCLIESLADEVDELLGALSEVWALV